MVCRRKQSVDAVRDILREGPTTFREIAGMLKMTPQNARNAVMALIQMGGQARKTDRVIKGEGRYPGKPSHIYELTERLEASHGAGAGSGR